MATATAKLSVEQIEKSAAGVPAVFLVKQGNKVVGMLEKYRSTRTETHPWKVFLGHGANRHYLGARYETGRAGAVAAIQNARDAQELSVMKAFAEEQASERAVAEHEARETFKGHTLAELRIAFERIQHPENWKLGLAGIIPVADLDKAQVAAEFYAGSRLDVIYTEPESFGPDRKCFVKGPGYYACVGS